MWKWVSQEVLARFRQSPPASNVGRLAYLIVRASYLRLGAFARITRSVGSVKGVRPRGSDSCSWSNGLGAGAAVRRSTIEAKGWVGVEERTWMRERDAFVVCGTKKMKGEKSDNCPGWR